MHKHDGPEARKGGGTVIVPRHSELSAARHDEAAVTVGGGGSWRRCVCSRDWKDKASRPGETAEAKVWRWDLCFHAFSCPHLFLLSEHTDHCLKPSVAPRPPTPGFQSWLSLLSAVRSRTGQLPLPASVSWSVNQDGYSPSPPVGMARELKERNTHSNAFGCK